ncbi:MAG: hypothetical protein ABW321_06445 [Polyangiales bacterium]
MSWISGLVVCMGMCWSLSAAHAQDAVDTVYLKNGGRVRGTVISEEPDAGVTLKQIDGKTRVIPAADVKQVEYAQPAAAPAPPPPVAAPGAAPAPLPVYTPYQTPAHGYQLEGNYVEQPRTRRRTGLLIVGIVAMSVGAILFATGTVTMASEDCFDGCSDSTQTPGTAAMVGGGILFSVGIPLVILGSIRVTDDRPRAAVPERALSLLPSIGRDGFGLRLAGTL